MNEKKTKDLITVKGKDLECLNEIFEESWFCHRVQFRSEQGDLEVIYVTLTQGAMGLHF